MAYERDSDSGRLIAAVDLGSNSFYLAVARITSSGLQVLKKSESMFILLPVWITTID